MSLQHTALDVPEGNDQGEWQLAGQPAEAQPDPNVVIDDAAEPAPIDEPVQPQTPQLSDLERVAIGLGWTPQSEWRGDPAKWTAADAYIRNTGKVLERTKQDLRFTRQQTDELNARLARIEAGQATLQDQRAQELFEQYEDAKFKAAQAGNTELYRKLTTEQQETLAKVRPAPQQKPSASEMDVHRQAEQIMSDPIAARFFEANPVALQDEAAWALMDREMTRAAQRGADPTAQFKAAEAALRYAYADAYERPAFNGNVPANQPHHSQDQDRDERGQFRQQTPPQQRRPAPPMNPASRVANPSAERSAVDRLPADARAFLKQEIAAGRLKAEESEDWAKYYHGGPVVVRGRAMGAKA